MSAQLFQVLNNGFLAIIALCTVIGTIVSFWAAKNTAATRETVKKQTDIITKLEINTNSMKDALVAATAKASQAEGMAEGIATERANPQSPTQVQVIKQPIDVKIIPDETIPVKQV